jgi:hypothetical protein
MQDREGPGRYRRRFSGAAAILPVEFDTRGRTVEEQTSGVVDLRAAGGVEAEIELVRGQRHIGDPQQVVPASQPPVVVDPVGEEQIDIADERRGRIAAASVAEDRDVVIVTQNLPLDRVVAEDARFARHSVAQAVGFAIHASAQLRAEQVIARAEVVIAHVAVSVKSLDVEPFFQIEVAEAAEDLDPLVFAEQVEFGVVDGPVPTEVHRVGVVEIVCDGRQRRRNVEIVRIERAGRCCAAVDAEVSQFPAATGEMSADKRSRAGIPTEIEVARAEDRVAGIVREHDRLVDGCIVSREDQGIDLRVPSRPAVATIAAVASEIATAISVDLDRGVIGRSGWSGSLGGHAMRRKQRRKHQDTDPPWSSASHAWFLLS